MLLLLLVALLPFPTSLLGSYPFRTIPVVVYGLNLLAINLTSLGMVVYVYHNNHLATKDFTLAVKKQFVRLFSVINAIYITAILLALFIPAVSYFIFIGVIVWLIHNSSRRAEVV